MRVLAVRLIVGAVLLGSNIACIAQEPPRDNQPPRQPGPGPGFGGPFGGPAMGGPMMMFAPNGIGFLDMQEVQKELSIRDDQKTAVQEAIQAERDKIRTIMEAFDPGEIFSLEPEERQAAFAAQAKKVEAGAEESIDRIAKVLDEKQMSRLRQLLIQREGVRSFERPKIVESLQLTKDQQVKIKELVAASSPRGFGGPGGPPGGPGFGPPAGGPPDMNAMQAQADKSRDEILALLTDEQRGKWERMKGTEFRFPQQQMGFGPPGMGQTMKLVAKFDKNKDGWLNRDERIAARVEAKSNPGGPGGGPGFMRRGGPGGGPPGGPGGPGGGPGGPGGRPGGFGPFGGEREPAKPGVKISKEEVKAYEKESLYDTNVLRTLFLDFDTDDWESELADFKPTDVEVDATMVVDGKTYANVGVSFRGSSSYFSIAEGHKRSFNITMDLVDSEQRLNNYKTLNLLNSNDDASMMHTVLYSHIASQYLPTPKANFVRVVVNGENWGIYQNVQQFNKDLISEWFPNSDGARWKVPGRPGGGGSLAYLGDRVDDYKRLYEIKSKDRDADWQALIELCRVLNQTPPEELETALEPILDVDSVLWYLAVDNVLINSDGYWIRASDYSLYRDADKKFHILPHDMNESFQPAMGPGMGGMGPGGMGPGGMGRGRGGRPGEQPQPSGQPGPGGNGNPRQQLGGSGPMAGSQVAIDPLIGLDDASKPLRHRLLAVPSLKKRYLEKVRTLATDALDWEKLGPVVEQYRKLIEEDVEKDTRKLSNFAAFQSSVSTEEPQAQERGRSRMSLKSFAEQRRKYLLEHPAIRALEE